jgi:hypothetical protein
MNIYLATSWKNEHYNRVLDLLRAEHHEVYDFRDKAFTFLQIHGAGVEDLPAKEQAALLDHPASKKAFDADMNGLQTSNCLVMLYPCGNDAHVELGWAAANGYYTIVYINDGYRVGLMDKVADLFVYSDQQLLQGLRT